MGEAKIPHAMPWGRDPAGGVSRRRWTCAPTCPTCGAAPRPALATNPEFQRMVEDIEHYGERRKRKTLPLHMAQRQKLIEEEEAWSNKLRAARLASRNRHKQTAEGQGRRRRREGGRGRRRSRPPGGGGHPGRSRRAEPRSRLQGSDRQGGGAQQRRGGTRGRTPVGLLEFSLRPADITSCLPAGAPSSGPQQTHSDMRQNDRNHDQKEKGRGASDSRRTGTGRNRDGDACHRATRTGERQPRRPRRKTRATPDYQALCEEAREKLLRHCAEFENYRKRVQREYEVVRNQTKAGTIEEFLTVYDHFGMALSHSDQDQSVLRQGMEMILAEFRRTFENLGVEELDAMGKPFDPDLHEAMAQEPSDDVPEGHVLRQWRTGFRMGGKLLRPASVVVSAGPDCGSASRRQRDEGRVGPRERPKSRLWRKTTTRCSAWIDESARRTSRRPTASSP